MPRTLRERVLKHPLRVNIDDELQARLKREAERTHRPVGQLVRVLVLEALDRRDEGRSDAA